MLSQRAAFTHGVIDGRTAQEFEPEGKAAEEIGDGSERRLRSMTKRPSLFAVKPTIAPAIVNDPQPEASADIAVASLSVQLRGITLEITGSCQGPVA
jgi:hypothetical protein